MAATLVVALWQEEARYRPTEHDFLNAVHEWAGSNARDCGLFERGESLEPAIPCVTESLASGEAFTFVHYGVGIDSIIAYGLASDGTLPARRFAYDSDTSGGGRNPGNSRLTQIDCPDPRIRKLQGGDSWTFDCGPRPTWLDYQDAVWGIAGPRPLVCGYTSAYSIERIAAAVACAEGALRTGTAFMFQFETQVDDATLAERMLVSGPGTGGPQLFWFRYDNSEATPFKAIMTRRECPSPSIRTGFRLRGLFERRYGVEVDCN